MSYGVLLKTTSGEVWVSPESIPLALLSKKSVTVSNPQAYTTITQAYDVNNPIIPFVRVNGTGALWYETNNGVCTVTIWNASQRAVVEAYFFSIFPQPMPASKYGIAIWDANSNLILTHETKTLTDVLKIGGTGSAGDNGINTNVTLTGKWGVVPEFLGMVVGVINDPYPRPFQSNVRAIAVASGNNTRIYGYGDGGAPTGGVSGISYINGHSNAIALRVGDYD